MHPMQSTTPTPPPSCATLAWVFMLIGMQSFGGGLSAWMRRDVVQRRGWMSEQQFVGGLALCQLTPGPNAVNLAVFIGSSLRGPKGAAAALAGMLLVPVLAILAMGAAFTELRDVPGVASAMAGLGAAAIGLNLAMALRMTRRGISGAAPAAVMAGVALAVGVFDLPLLPVVLLALPAGVLAARPS